MCRGRAPIRPSLAPPTHTLRSPGPTLLRRRSPFATPPPRTPFPTIDFPIPFYFTHPIPRSPPTPRCTFHSPPPLSQPHCTRHRLLFLYHIIRAPLRSCSVSLRRTPLSSIILPTTCCRRRLSDTSTAALSAFSHSPCSSANARTDTHTHTHLLIPVACGLRCLFFVSEPVLFFFYIFASTLLFPFFLSFHSSSSPHLIRFSGQRRKTERQALAPTTANDTNVTPLFKLGRELCFCSSIRAPLRSVSVYTHPRTILAATPGACFRRSAAVWLPTPTCGALTQGQRSGLPFVTLF
ncbi:unnamed protein product [Chondrus crispus]|uniref:Uncharacterized protein n=1 Tax=Chondrus crispus TaxID=2769 RepID=R7QT02_CHOCR|nr:unnamed protein product [Chondrus crispus]CDF40475.1 unnamed protein product [Chondrus crispus]|eukprot:XP_005710769.1 unnamed protein product [Chondrus crispus]